MQDVKIGVVVADYDEYEPFVKAICEAAPKEYNYFNRKAISFDLGKATIICINCGIGKVNAATAAMHLADIGCTYILNYGLSGGISKVCRGEIVLPDKFLEHDFDLTGIGYKPCEKPSQKYIYDADKKLLKIAESAIGNVSTELRFAVIDLFVMLLTEIFYAIRLALLPAIWKQRQ